MSLQMDIASKPNFIHYIRMFRRILAGLAALAVLLFGVLALFVVPAPKAGAALEISGSVESISRPHPKYGDIGILLEAGGRYYINRADEIPYLDWEKMLSELKPGDEIQLTVVKPLAWHWLGDDTVAPMPVAGLRSGNIVYMDAAISAQTWTAQANFSQMAILSLLVLVLCLLPEVQIPHRQPSAV